MLSVVLRGKLPIVEDVLTAAVFDALSDSGDPQRLRALLEGAMTVDERPLLLPPFDSFDTEMWPRTSGGEPDVRLRLLSNGREVGRVLIEAKLWAAKSGLGETDDDPGAGTRGDQLARYLLAEWRQDKATPVWLVYLTHHSIFPGEDVEASALELERRGRRELAGCIHWRSWRHLEPVIAGWTRPWGRVAEVLARAAMFRFRGKLPSVPAMTAEAWSYPARVPPMRRREYLWPTPASPPAYMFCRQPGFRWRGPDTPLLSHWEYSSREDSE